jgi:hypothetical protein
VQGICTTSAKTLSEACLKPGFEVLDLGIDVAPETVLETAKAENNQNHCPFRRPHAGAGRHERRRGHF